MPDLRKNKTPMSGRRRNRGVSPNRECSQCVYPCQGGEVLHRRGPCCKRFCPCEAFVPKAFVFQKPSLAEFLDKHVRKARMGKGPAA